MTPQTTTTRSLTEIERWALDSNVINLADAHARQRLHAVSVARLQNVIADCLMAHKPDYHAAEAAFLANLARHTGQQYGSSTHVTYAATVALDIVAKYLCSQRGVVGMITPAFDCIPAVFARNGLALSAVPEARVTPKVDFDFLDSLALAALVLILPNNPTGSRPAPGELVKLLEWSASRRVCLVLDLSFRMLDDGLCLDIVKLADEMSADVVTVDDTGKTISLYDTKMGVLATTRRIADEIDQIRAEILLNVSELDLRLLAALLEDRTGGEVAAARRLIRVNQEALNRWLPARVEQAHVVDSGFQPSVGWLRLGAGRDRILDDCRRRCIEVLPGDLFFWDEISSSGNAGSELIRVPFMRDPDYFERGVELLVDVVDRRTEDRRSPSGAR